MIRLFLISAIRNLRKNRLYTAINVLGLALGVACCLVIFVIVKYETSFDDYHTKASRIYRVNLNQQTAQGRQFNGNNYSPLAETIRAEVSGLETVTGVYCLEAYQFSKGDDLFEDRFAFFADESYANVFDVAWMAGNPQEALRKPNTAVVTDSFAEKFLGGVSNALGSNFVLENKLPLTVTGVVRTPPSNTDHPYSILISYSSLAHFIPETVDNWETVGNGATYVVFHANTSRDQIDRQLDNLLKKYLTKDDGKKTSFHLMALNDNHDRNYDYSSFNYDFPVPVMVILSIIAGMIAFIACINYVNLATAQSLKRAKEVGLRKTMGGSRWQLITQYMSEAFVITLLAVVAGMALAKVGMIQLNKVYGGNYLEFNLLNEPWTLVFLLGITILISVLAGFYPAFVLSAYKPVLALRSQTYSGRSKGLSIRRALVVLQFAGAQILILVTIIIINQISFFKERPIGFDPEAVVLMTGLHGNENHEFDKLSRALESVPGVTHFTFGNAGNDRGEFYIHPEKKYVGLISYVDSSYIHVFESKMLSGKNLMSDNHRASSTVLVNETLIRQLEIPNAASAIGTVFALKDQELMIGGVVKDTYTHPMSSKVDPVILQYHPEKFAAVAMKISTDHVQETLAGIEKAWKQAYPDYLCKYQFMDDALNRQYGFYNVIFTFMGTASFLAIFIGCLGLYGLVSFMAIQRTKEIGIRKVLGATVSNIMMLFTKESAILIAVAFVFAAPLAHFTGIGILLEFPERVQPGVGIFIATFIASLLIAVVTVAYRSFNAAVQSPVDSLRTE